MSSDRRRTAAFPAGALFSDFINVSSETSGKGIEDEADPEGQEGTLEKRAARSRPNLQQKVHPF